MRPHFPGRCVEHRHLTNACGDHLVVAAGERPQVQVAHWAAGEPPELQVDQAVRVWDGNRCTRDGGELASWDDMTGGESHAAPLVSVRSRPPKHHRNSKLR